MLLGGGCRLLALVAAELFGSLTWRGWALNVALPLQLEWHEALQAVRISSPNRGVYLVCCGFWLYLMLGANADPL